MINEKDEFDGAGSNRNALMPIIMHKLGQTHMPTIPPLNSFPPSAAVKVILSVYLWARDAMNEFLFHKG